MTSEDNSPPDVTKREGDESITNFAPFESLKPARSRFQRSAECVDDSGSFRVDPQSREIEFHSSESQSSGNPKVLFRKIKAAVSGSNISSSYSAQYPSDNSKPLSLGGPTTSLGGQRSTADHAPSSASIKSAPTSIKHSEPSMAASIEQTVREFDSPKISLTSYSDPHHMPPRVGGAAGGVARPQAQAVNKTEMLKRFGSIAESQVQVCVCALLVLVCTGST